MLFADEQNRQDVKDVRERWQAELGGLDPDRLVFIDESSTKTNLARLRGRAPRGQRVIRTMLSAGLTQEVVLAYLETSVRQPQLTGPTGGQQRLPHQ